MSWQMSSCLPLTCYSILLGIINCMVIPADAGGSRIHSRVCRSQTLLVSMCTCAYLKCHRELPLSSRVSKKNTVKLLEIWNFFRKAKKKTHLWISLGLPAKVLQGLFFLGRAVQSEDKKGTHRTQRPNQGTRAESSDGMG